MTAADLAADLAQRCQKPRQTKDGWKACCPAHDDQNPSLDITPSTDRILLCCRAGCTFDAIVAAFGLTEADFFLRPPTSGRKRIVATYAYLDVNGHVLHETVRYEPKAFRQRRPDPAKAGAYLWNLKGIEPILYGLSALVTAVHAGQTIYLPEGEKHCEALWALGLAATTNPMGAEKWRKSYTETLRGAHVVILPDNDTPGRKHLAKVLQSLYGTAASIKVVELPGLPDKGDVIDWLAAGGDRAQLEALTIAALRWEPQAATTVNGTPPGPAPRSAGTDGDRRGPYQATRQGLSWWKETAHGAVEVPLTNFVARIVADVLQDDGSGETRRAFEIEATHEGRTVRFPVDASHFAGMTWAMEHLGARAMVLPGTLLKDHARAAVQMFSQAVEPRTIYTHLGWRQVDGTWLYLHAAGAIGPDGPVSSVEVDARHTLAAYLLPGLTTPEEERTALRASLTLLTTADDAVTIPLYAAIWRAVLGQADFSVHLVGPTGAGKSELAALAQQHYGAGMTARHLPAAWTSTGNALEGLAFEAKDVVLVVDDFCPSGSQADIQRFHKDADRLLRAQGNHSGRQRMNRDGTLRAVKPPRGLIVSTGEDTPQGQSLRARILILDVAPGSVQWDTLTACQQDAADGTYATALAGFVQWLAPRYEAVSRGLQAEITTLRHAVLTSGHRRTPELVGNLALGMQYLLAYGHDIGALTLEECTHVMQWTWKALVNAAEAQSEHQTNEEPVRRFLALLAGALAAGLAHVADAHTLAAPSTQPQHWGWRGQEYREDDDIRMSWSPQGPCVGWLANERLYLEPEAAFSVVQRLGESQKAPVPITQQTLWKRMHEQGLLIREDGQSKNKVRVTVGNERRYVVNIATSLLSETGPTGPTGPNSQEPQQQQGQTVDRFPSWYHTKPVHSPITKPVHTNAPQSPEPWTGFAPEPWTGFQTEPVHKNAQHPQQQQGLGPVGPVGPVSTTVESQTFADATHTTETGPCRACGGLARDTMTGLCVACWPPPTAEEVAP